MWSGRFFPPAHVQRVGVRQEGRGPPGSSPDPPRPWPSWAGGRPGFPGFAEVHLDGDVLVLHVDLAEARGHQSAGPSFWGRFSRQLGQRSPQSRPWISQPCVVSPFSVGFLKTYKAIVAHGARSMSSSFFAVSGSEKTRKKRRESASFMFWSRSTEMLSVPCSSNSLR